MFHEAVQAFTLTAVDTSQLSVCWACMARQQPVSTVTGDKQPPIAACT